MTMQCVNHCNLHNKQMCHHLQSLTWSLVHSKLSRPLLIDERRKCRPWSAMRKFRSPKQNTALIFGRGETFSKTWISVSATVWPTLKYFSAHDSIQTRSFIPVKMIAKLPAACVPWEPLLLIVVQMSQVLMLACLCVGYLLVVKHMCSISIVKFLCLQYVLKLIDTLQGVVHVSC